MHGVRVYLVMNSDSFLSAGRPSEIIRRRINLVVSDTSLFITSPHNFVSARVRGVLFLALLRRRREPPRLRTSFALAPGFPAGLRTVV